MLPIVYLKDPFICLGGQIFWATEVILMYPLYQKRKINETSLNTILYLNKGWIAYHMIIPQTFPPHSEDNEYQAHLLAMLWKV